MVRWVRVRCRRGFQTETWLVLSEWGAVVEFEDRMSHVPVSLYTFSLTSSNYPSGDLEIAPYGRMSVRSRSRCFVSRSRDGRELQRGRFNNFLTHQNYLFCGGDVIRGLLITASIVSDDKQSNEQSNALS